MPVPTRTPLPAPRPGGTSHRRRARRRAAGLLAATVAAPVLLGASAGPAVALAPAPGVATRAPRPVAGDGRLAPGVELGSGQALATGTTRLLMQPDGNLVLRAAGVLTWASRTFGHNGAHAVVEPGARVAVRTAAGTLLWASPTRTGTAPTLVVGDDGNFGVVASGHPVWTSNTAIRGYAASRFPVFHWPSSQFWCLDRLWTRESNWNPVAANPSSSAYGIPQALPGSKMASVAADWRTNPRTQEIWGMEYIADRYGTPCAAWAHSQSFGWYSAPTRPLAAG